MQGYFKKTLFALTALTALIGSASLVFSLLFHPTHFQKKLFHSIERSTGYHVTTATAVTWSFVPWVGVDLHRLELHPANPSDPEITIDHTHIIIAPLPLFIGNIKPDAISLRGVHIHRTSHDISVDHPLTWVTHALKHWPHYFRHISLEITESDILTTDHKPWIDQWIFHAHGITRKQPFTVSTTMRLAKNNIIVHASALLKQEENALFLKNTHIELTGGQMLNPFHPIRMSANLTLHPKDHEISIKDLVLSSDSLRIQGAMTIHNWHDITESWQGEMTLPSNDLTPFLRGHHLLPFLTNHDVLHALRANLKLSPGHIAVLGELDHQSFRGKFSFHKKTANAHFQSFNLTNYLSKESVPKEIPEPSGIVKEMSLPIDWQFILTADQGTWNDTPIQNLHIKLSSTPDHWQFSGIHLETLSGKLDGEVNLEKNPPYTHSMQMTLDHINVNPLLKAFNFPITISSPLHALIALNMQGNDLNDWMKSFNGHGSLTLGKGEIKGLHWSDWYKKVPHINLKTLHPTLKTNAPLSLHHLALTYTITQHQVNVSMLQLKGNPLDATGSGLLDFYHDKLNFGLHLSTPGIDDVPTVEFKFFGNIENPTILPNLQYTQHHPYLKMKLASDYSTEDY